MDRKNLTCKVSNFEVRLLLSYFKVFSELLQHTNSELLQCNFSVTFELLNLQVRLLLSTFLTPTVYAKLIFWSLFLVQKTSLFIFLC